MSQQYRTSTEVQHKTERRHFNVAYKRRIVAEADQCQRGELGALLRREGLTYKQISQWRKATIAGTLGKKRGPVANPNRAEMRRLQTENVRLRCKLADTEAIIAPPKS